MDISLCAIYTTEVILWDVLHTCKESFHYILFVLYIHVESDVSDAVFGGSFK